MPAHPDREAWLSALVVTVLVTAASAFVPAHWVASAVGGTFLGATWLLVFRKDDATILHAGLAFAGVVLPRPIDPRTVLGELRTALAWALGTASLVFGPFYLGFRFYAQHVWHAAALPWPALHWASALGEVFGQLTLIALPEEAFYRGYLQTRFDDAWPPRWQVGGAFIGPSLLATSAIFAAGHVLTIHEAGRLAVFFPSLLFGWLRARTGGVGASIIFHASCNLFSATLLQAYGPH